MRTNPKTALSTAETSHALRPVPRKAPASPFWLHLANMPRMTCTLDVSQPPKSLPNDIAPQNMRSREITAATCDRK